jgi:hypothetical protein
MCSRADFPPYDESTPLVCDACGAPATHRVSEVALPGAVHLVCGMAVAPFADDDRWAIHKLRRVDVGLPPLPRKGAHV